MGIRHSVVRKVISFTLLVCFTVTNISPALAQNNQPQIALDPAQFTDMNPDKFMQSPENLSAEEKAELKKFLSQPTEVTLEILFLLKNLYHKVKMAEQKLGTNEVTKILSKRKDSESIEFEIEKLGKAEPLVINTSRGPLFFTKVRHNKLKMVMLFIDKSQIDMEFLIESERMEKLGLSALDPTLSGLSKEQRMLELDHRRFILKQIRTLYAKMLMSEWNPKLEYLPLHQQTEASKVERETPPEELKSKVNEVLEKPFEELQNKPWFKKVSEKSFNTWMDLVKQENDARSKTQGHEALMLMMYDSKASGVQQDTVRKASKFSLNYWKMWWTSIYETPSYGKPVWENNKGLGKLKVLLTGDYLVGLGFGVSLGFLSAATTVLIPGALPEGLTPLGVTTVSFGYSLFFGVFGKTWANFVYRGNEFQRFIKNWGPGIAQSYTYNLLSSESLSVIGSNGRFDINAMKVHADILLNQSIKTVTKTSLQNIPKHRDKTGEAEGTLKVPYFKVVAPWKHNMKFMEIEATETTIDTLKLYKWIRNQLSLSQGNRSWEEKFILRFQRDWKISAPWLIRKEYDTHIPRKNYENQAIQFVTTPIGLLSRFGFSIPIPGTGISVPVGHLLYMALGPIGDIRYIRHLRDYVVILNEHMGEQHPFTKRARAELVREVTEWNNLMIGKWAKIEFYKNLNSDSGKTTIFGYEPRILSREDYTKEVLDGRGDKPTPSFAIPNPTQFIGYYVKAVPLQIWETTKEIANWIARKTAYHSYKVYQSIDEDLKKDAERKAQAQEAIERYKRVMTVQTDGGRPHPQQIRSEISRSRGATCVSLFR